LRSLQLSQPPLIEPSAGYVTLDIPKPKPDTVLLSNILGLPEICGHSGNIAFPIGLGVDNNPVIADFSNPNQCHALVAGVAGSGKSEFLKSVVASLVKRNKSQYLKFSIIDPKMLTFGGIEQSPFLSDPVMFTIEKAIDCLRRAVEDMDKRYFRLKQEGRVNLTERFNAGERNIPFHVIVFDEFSDLILSGKDEKKEFEILVSRLAAKGRAAGIHLILATQRPDAKVVTGQIKANLPLVVCLRVTNSTNSNIILDQPGGEKLIGRGDLLCNLGNGLIRAQSPFIPQEEFINLLTND